MEELFNNFLGDVAFPILVSIFLLTRIERRLSAIDTNIIELKSLINKIKDNKNDS